MTQKDYIKIAAVLADSKRLYASVISYRAAWHKLVNDLVVIFKDDNPNFNAAKFIEACER